MIEGAQKFTDVPIVGHPLHYLVAIVLTTHYFFSVIFHSYLFELLINVTDVVNIKYSTIISMFKIV